MKKILLTGILLFAAIYSNAAIIDVTNSNDTGSGSLRQSISDANGSLGVDTILFEIATNGVPIVLTSGQLNVTEGLVIIGNGSSNTSIQGGVNIIAIAPNINMTIRGLSFSNFSNYGITRPFSSATSCDLEVNNCEFVGNGGGVGIQFSVIDGSVIVDSCNFSNLLNGTQIESCTNATVRYNYATNCTGSSGGTGIAIYNSYGSGTTIVTNNTAEDCNIGLNVGTSLIGDISNNTSYNNTSIGMLISFPSSGGGGSPALIISNNTLANNQVGLEIDESNSDASNVTIQNCVLWNNSFTDFYLNSLFMSGGNPISINNIGSNSNSSYGPLTFFSTLDPLLDVFGTQNNGGYTPTVLISNGSIAINNGTAINAPITDQRGFSRVGQTDIGAFEFDGIDCSSPVSGTDVITECNSFTWIDGNTYTASNFSATFNIVGGAANGCDSVVTLNLTLNTVSDITTTTSGLTISANFITTQYQWLDCDDSYAPISGETLQAFTATSNGNYAVQMTSEDGCTDTSACVAITTVGLFENNFTNAIVLYPNPTEGNFSIDLGENYVSAIVTITNLNGQVVQSEVHGAGQTISMKLEAPAGIYLLSIETGDKRAVLRFVKR